MPKLTFRDLFGVVTISRNFWVGLALVTFSAVFAASAMKFFANRPKRWYTVWRMLAIGLYFAVGLQIAAWIGSFWE